jgi:hypothetical protein
LAKRFRKMRNTVLRFRGLLDDELAKLVGLSFGERAAAGAIFEPDAGRIHGPDARRLKFVAAVENQLRGELLQPVGVTPRTKSDHFSALKCLIAPLLLLRNKGRAEG